MHFIEARRLAAGLVSCTVMLLCLVTDAGLNAALALQPRGIWSASVTYALHDLVILRGSTWRSKHNNNLNKLPGSTSPSTALDWEPFASGLNPRRAWNSSTKIRPRPSRIGGSTWWGLRTNLNKILGQNAADWALFASRGATGAQGPQGVQGPRGPAGPNALVNGTLGEPAILFLVEDQHRHLLAGGRKDRHGGERRAFLARYRHWRQRRARPQCAQQWGKWKAEYSCGKFRAFQQRHQL